MKESAKITIATRLNTSYKKNNEIKCIEKIQEKFDKPYLCLSVCLCELVNMWVRSTHTHTPQQTVFRGVKTMKAFHPMIFSFSCKIYVFVIVIREMYEIWYRCASANHNTVLCGIRRKSFRLTLIVLSIFIRSLSVHVSFVAFFYIFSTPFWESSSLQSGSFLLLLFLSILPNFFMLCFSYFVLWRHHWWVHIAFILSTWLSLHLDGHRKQNSFYCEVKERRDWVYFCVSSFFLSIQSLYRIKSTKQSFHKSLLLCFGFSLFCFFFSFLFVYCCSLCCLQIYIYKWNFQLSTLELLRTVQPFWYYL